MQSGLEFTKEYEGLMDDYLAKSAASRKKLLADTTVAKKGPHKGEQLHEYTLEEYGLSKEIVEKEFADYISLYNLAK